MGDKFVKGFAMSMKTCSAYNDLRCLSFDYKEDTDEYKEALKKLKELIHMENECYKELDLEQVDNYLSKIDMSLLDEVTERYYNKLMNRFKLLTDEIRLDDDTFLSTIIDSKILIDTLKKVENSIISTEATNDQDEVLSFDLLAYHNTSKYTFLSSNNFIEKISLRCGFDLDKLPLIDMTKLEYDFNIDIMSEAQNIFAFYIKDNIDYLFNTKEVYKDLKSIYFSLLKASELEVLLSLINRGKLSEIIKYYNEKVSECKNPVSSKCVRRLINNRKEEFRK